MGVQLRHAVPADPAFGSSRHRQRAQHAGNGNLLRRHLRQPVEQQRHHGRSRARQHSSRGNHPRQRLRRRRGRRAHTIEPPATSGGPETPRFYEYGARGDVTGHSNTSGTPIFRAVYKAFGDHTDSGSAGPNRQRASTKDEESTLGLLNEGYRWRDITTGTFLSRDPAGFVDGPNLYSYVRQNPWSKFDPHGLQAGDPRALWSPIVREQIIQNLKNSAAQAGSTAADFIPVVGTIKGADETVGGKDRLTGKELSTGERVLSGVGTAASLLPAGKPAVKGVTKLYRKIFGQAGGEVVEAAVKTAEAAVKTAPEAVEAAVRVVPEAVADSAKTIVNVAEEGVVRAFNSDGHLVTTLTNAGGSTITGAFDAAAGTLHIQDVWVTLAERGQGIGTQLYKDLISKYENIRTVTGIAGGDNAAAIAKGGILETPRAKILSKLGFTEHSFDEATDTMRSSIPDKK